MWKCININIFISILMVQCGLIANCSFAADGQINFSGTIHAATCDVNISSRNQSINIGTFSTADFSTVGNTTIFKPLYISLRNCTQGINGAKVFFSGTQDKDNSDLLALEDTGGTGQMASGVGVEILDVNQKQVPINNADSDSYALTKRKNTLAFYLRYKSTLSVVKAGNATAVMYFDIQYQ